MTAGSITVADKINTLSDVLSINSSIQYCAHKGLSSSCCLFGIAQSAIVNKQRKGTTYLRLNRIRDLTLWAEVNAHTHEDNRSMSWCHSWTVINLHMHVHKHTRAQQDKPALVVPGLFDFWDEMSEQSTPRHYRKDVCVCVFAQAHTHTCERILCACACERFYSIPKRKS